MKILNSIGFAGLAWCVAFYLLSERGPKTGPVNEMGSYALICACLALIPALFAFLAAL